MDKTEAFAFIKSEYERLDKICHVDTSKVEISFSTRMTRQLGCFSFKRNVFSEKLSIKISDKILNDPELFLDVIRHEYAHAVVHIRHPKRKHLHDDVWKAACLEIGCIPKATQKALSFDIPVQSRPDKFILRCNGCGAESRYKQESKIIKIALGKRRGQIVCKVCHKSNFTVEKI